MNMRPTPEDSDALDMLLSVDTIDEKSALFCEGLYERRVWSVKQCDWFDKLCERYL